MSRDDGREIPERYGWLSRLWMNVGFVAPILPLANLYFIDFSRARAP